MNLGPVEIWKRQRERQREWVASLPRLAIAGWGTTREEAVANLVANVLDTYQSLTGGRQATWFNYAKAADAKAFLERTRQ